MPTTSSRASASRSLRSDRSPASRRSSPRRSARSLPTWRPSWRPGSQLDAWRRRTKRARACWPLRSLVNRARVISSLSGFGSFSFPLGIEAEELGQAFPFKLRDGRDGEPGARGPTWIDPPSDSQKGILKRGAATGVVDASWKPPSNPTADPDSVRFRVPSSGWKTSGQNLRFERETTAVPSEARGQHPGARPTSTWPR